MDLNNNENGEITAQQGSSKTGRVIKKVLKIVFFSVIAVIWGLILLTIFLRGDDDILETPILSDEARAIYSADKDNFIVYRVHPAVFMTGDGSLQLSSAVYAESAHEFEIGTRIAWTQLRYCEECETVYTPEQLEKQLKEDSENARDNEFYEPEACLTIHTVKRASLDNRRLYYTLTDSDGNVYPQAHRAHRVKNLNLLVFAIKYEYERVSFSGLYFDIENNIINRGGEETESEEEKPTGVSYYLNIYDRQGGNLLFSTCIYDLDTYISRTSFKYPDGDYIADN